MKRTKKLPSRKAKTLRRGIVLAVCLVGILALYQPCLTPGQAIRASETELGWEKTQVLGETQVLSRRVTLSANRDGLMTTVFRPFQPLSPLLGRQGEALLCASNTPSQAYPSSLTAIPFQPEEGKEGSLLLFGPVDLAEAAAVRVYDKREEALSDLSLEAPLSTGADGRQMVCTTLPLPAQEITFHPSWHEILDQAGHILYAGPLSYTAPVSSIDPMIS